MGGRGSRSGKVTSQSGNMPKEITNKDFDNMSEIEVLKTYKNEYKIAEDLWFELESTPKSDPKYEQKMQKHNIHSQNGNNAYLYADKKGFLPQRNFTIKGNKIIEQKPIYYGNRSN